MKARPTFRGTAMRAGIALATLLALSACGGGGSAGNEPPADVSISTPQGKAEIRSGAAAVANWPEGVPPYPGADTNQSVNVTGGAPGGTGRILGFRTGDSPQQVIAFYAPAVVRSGYSVANQMDLGQTATLSARRGQGEALNITATRTGDVTQVQIIAAAGQ
jgi:predicted small lipoprotein YifL